MDFLRERIGEIISQLNHLRYPIQKNISSWKGKDGHFQLEDKLSIDTSGWEIADPEMLGRNDSAYFGLETEVEIPEEMAGMPVELSLSTGREGEWDATNPQMAAYVNGTLWQGIDVNHRTVRLTECAAAGQQFRVFLSVYTGETGSVTKWNSELRAVDMEVHEFYYDLRIPWECLGLMDETGREYQVLLQLLNSTINLLDLRKKSGTAFRDSLKKAKAYLAEEITKLPKSDITATCVGHTHIDVAWLWTLAVTEEKSARSFSTVLKLMERYPEYMFFSSQPQLYQYVKRNQPKLYEKLKARVKEGRWEPDGAMFLEADCNLTSGESLVRQCLYGKQFFKEEFDTDSRIMWLPDVFGYSAALPQILRKSGIDSFMTTKISWNEVNKIPCDTFWWEGIDGTRILTHFVTTRDYNNNGKTTATSNEFTTSFSTNYNGVIHPSQVKGAWQRYQEKGLHDNILISYGYGDGGGGPTEEMLETARRLDGHFDCPAVRMEKASDFFERLHRRAEEVKFPLWSGELYLEYHRGTYTSMAENKRFNRKGEFALQNLETWAVLSEQAGGEAYPYDSLKEGWEILMRNQFHDILPGSAIREVYEDSRKEYENLLSMTANLTGRALDHLADVCCAETGSLLVFNANGTVSDEIVEIPDKNKELLWITAFESNGELLPVQRTEDDMIVFRAKNVPVKGWRTYKPISRILADTEEEFYCTDAETVTPFYHIKWNGFGHMTSLYDRREVRELLQPGQTGNVLMTYEDKPHIYDNWNIFEYHREKSWPVEELISRKVTECGPVRIALELIWKYQDSRIAETLYFYPDSPRIDIHAEIDWQEDQILLKVLFPLDLNTREATYEIQYGNVKRSTTANHSWEKARFEVCFQKWFDLSEQGYGISFLTDCKYGVSIQENQVGLTLLKSGCYPYDRADRGFHTFTYAIFPHQGSWQEARTVQEAYGLNNPPSWKIKSAYTAAEAVTLSQHDYSAVQISSSNIIPEVLKKAENGTGYILRLYECWNRRTRARLTFPERFGKAILCSMTEEDEMLLAQNQDSCILEFKPYEIITLRITSES